MNPIRDNEIKTEGSPYVLKISVNEVAIQSIPTCRHIEGDHN